MKGLAFVARAAKTGKDAALLEMRFRSNSERQLFFFAGDVHYDHAHCDRERFHRDMQRACAAGAAVVFPGDFNCAMQGKWDKRADRNSLREEYQSGAYLERLATVAVEDLMPYRHNIVLMSEGNHESAIYKRHEFPLLHFICRDLGRAGSPVLHMPYQGMARFAGSYHKTLQTSLVGAYSHGHGGGGPVTKDMIQRARHLERWDGIDLFWFSHTHDRWIDETVRRWLDKNGQVRRRSTWTIKCGTYKDAYAEEYGDGFEAEKGHPPKPLGGVYVEMGFTSERRLTITRVWPSEA